MSNKGFFNEHEFIKDVESTPLPNTDGLDPIEHFGQKAFKMPSNELMRGVALDVDEVDVRMGDLIDARGSVPLIFMQRLPGCLLVLCGNEPLTIRITPTKVLSAIDEAP